MGTSGTATHDEHTPGPRGGGRLTKLDPRALRHVDVRIFSSASDAPRARRPTDVVLLILSVLGVVILSFFAPGPTAVDRTLSDLISELPGLFGWFWEISYDLLFGWALLLLLFALVARGRKRLFLTELLAGALALGLSLLAGKAAGTDWSSSLKGIGSSRAAGVPRDPARHRHRDRRDGLAAHEPPDPVHRPLDRDGRRARRRRARRHAARSGWWRAS